MSVESVKVSPITKKFIDELSDLSMYTVPSVLTIVFRNFKAEADKLIKEGVYSHYGQLIADMNIKYHQEQETDLETALRKWLKECTVKDLNHWNSNEVILNEFCKHSGFIAHVNLNQRSLSVALRKEGYLISILKKEPGGKVSRGVLGIKLLREVEEEQIIDEQKKSYHDRLSKVFARED